jgi:hypothetical protein
MVIRTTVCFAAVCLSAVAPFSQGSAQSPRVTALDVRTISTEFAPERVSDPESGGSVWYFEATQADSVFDVEIEFDGVDGRIGIEATTSMTVGYSIGNTIRVSPSTVLVRVTSKNGRTTRVPITLRLTGPDESTASVSTALYLARPPFKGQEGCLSTENPALRLQEYRLVVRPEVNWSEIASEGHTFTWREASGSLSRDGEGWIARFTPSEERSNEVIRVALATQLPFRRNNAWVQRRDICYNVRVVSPSITEIRAESVPGLTVNRFYTGQRSSLRFISSTPGGDLQLPQGQFVVTDGDSPQALGELVVTDEFADGSVQGVLELQDRAVGKTLFVARAGEPGTSLHRIAGRAVQLPVIDSVKFFREENGETTSTTNPQVWPNDRPVIAIYGKHFEPDLTVAVPTGATYEVGNRGSTKIELSVNVSSNVQPGADLIEIEISDGSRVLARKSLSVIANRAAQPLSRVQVLCETCGDGIAIPLAGSRKLSDSDLGSVRLSLPPAVPTDEYGEQHLIWEVRLHAHGVDSIFQVVDSIPAGSTTSKLVDDLFAGHSADVRNLLTSPGSYLVMEVYPNPRYHPDATERQRLRIGHSGKGLLLATADLLSGMMVVREGGAEAAPSGGLQLEWQPFANARPRNWRLHAGVLLFPSRGEEQPEPVEAQQESDTSGFLDRFDPGFHLGGSLNVRLAGNAVSGRLSFSVGRSRDRGWFVVFNPASLGLDFPLNK